MAVYGMSNLLDFTANGTRTYWDSAGILRTAAADEPRWDYDPATGLIRGLMKEQSRTNLITRSSELDHADWTKRNLSITSNAAVAPDGTMAMDKIVESSDIDDQLHDIQQQAPVAIGNAYTFSVYATPGERSIVYFTAFTFGFPGNTADRTGYFDLSTGEVGTLGSSIDSARIVTTNGGRYRLEVTLTASADETATLSWGIAGADGVREYQGDGASGVYLWGAQMEAATYATSYIETAGSAVTRAADDVRISAANVAAQLGGLSEGTFVIGLESRGVDIGSGNFILSRGSSGRFAYRQADGVPERVRSFDGTNSVRTDTASEVRKFAIAWSGSTRSQSANGDPVDTGAWDGDWGSGDLIIGEQNWDGWVNYLEFIPRRQSDSELPTETAL